MNAGNTCGQLLLNGSLRTALVWLVVISALPLAGLAVTLSLAGMHGTGGASQAAYLVPVVLVVGLGFVGFRISRAGASVKNSTLIIDTGFGSKQIALSALQSRSQRVVDLSERVDLRPQFRLWGVSLPGFSAGWFRLRNGDKALCLLLDRSRVCYLRSDAGETLLLSLQQPELLKALIDHAPGG